MDSRTDAHGNPLRPQELASLRAGDEVVLALTDPHAFIVAFWSCLLGRMVAVPVQPPANDEHRLKLTRILGLLHRPFLLADRVETGVRGVAYATAASEAGAPGQIDAAAGPDEVKASVDLLVASGSATWRVTRVSGQELNVQLVASSGLPAELLAPIRSFSFSIPKLPFGLTIQSVSVTSSGIVGQISATNVAFSQ